MFGTLESDYPFRGPKPDIDICGGGDGRISQIVSRGLRGPQLTQTERDGHRLVEACVAVVVVVVVMRAGFDEEYLDLVGVSFCRIFSVVDVEGALMCRWVWCALHQPNVCVRKTKVITLITRGRRLNTRTVSVRVRVPCNALESCMAAMHVSTSNL